MKKVVSNALYVLFFGFAATLVIACIMLVINVSNGEGQSVNDIEAVKLSGTVDDEIKYDSIDKEILGEGAGEYQFVPVRYGYDALDTDKKRYLYTHLAAGVYSVSNDADQNGRYRISRIKVRNHKLSEFDIREVVNAFINDNPEIFWIENLFGYAYADEDTIVEFYSVLSADDCEKYIDRFNKKVKEILSGLEKGKTEYVREKYIHDAVLGGCSYKTGVKTSSDGWQYFTSYGALVDGEAVCEGYAKSMQLLLSRVGINSVMIKGDAEGVAHMWNAVELNGEWYHVDPTWDDGDPEGVVSYEYFNLTTESISKNHIICDDIETAANAGNENEVDPLVKYNFYVPMCTVSDMNYYYVEGVYIETFDSKTDELLTNAIVDRVKKGETYIPVRFGSEMPYADYISKMFNDAPFKFYYCLENASSELGSKYKIDMGSVSVLKNESSLTLRIRLKYENTDARQ